MQIVWTKEAQEDLENIYRFWASKNEQYSARLYNSLIDEAEVLRRFPKIGVLERFLTHRPEQFRSLLANKYYKLVYTVVNDDSSYTLYGTAAATGWTLSGPYIRGRT